MDKLITFFTIVAWVMGVIFTLWGFFVLYMGLTYPGSFDEMRDKLHGKVKTFNPFKSLGIAFICWAFIIAFW